MVNLGTFNNGSQITLGQKYRDTVTGLEGTAFGISTWLTGCDTVGLQPGLDKNGAPREVYWVDVNRLEAVQVAESGFAARPRNKPTPMERKTGGPQEAPHMDAGRG